MTFYSLLTVAGTVSLVFGGNYNTKDRLSYSEDKHDYPSKQWASDKYDSDRPSGYGKAYKYDPYERTYGRAYRHDPYERTYGKAYSYDPYQRTYGKAYSMHKDDDDKHYDDDDKDYRSSKQWKRPSYSSKDLKGWKKDNYDHEPSKDVKYGQAYSYDPYERTYGKAYSTKDYKKDHNVEEPAVTASPQHWKKSDYPQPSRDWKKNDGKYSSKDEPKGYKGYSSKDEPKGHKYEPSTHTKRDYSSKDEPKHEPNKHKDYSAKDEPKDHKDDHMKPKHKQPKDDAKHGTAYTMTVTNNNCPAADFDLDGPCDYEGYCEFGQESCCGKTFASKICECAGFRSYCLYTEACYGARC